MKQVQSLFAAIFLVISASCHNSNFKYCLSSEVAVSGISAGLEQFQNVNSHFYMSDEYKGCEITAAPTHQGYKIVVISSEKIDELKISAIINEVRKRLE